jgi:hypothetical protein
VVNQAVADQKADLAPRPIYEKPALQRLGLLRLMTRYSFAGDDGRDHDHHHRRDD